jgi:DNA mismatch endonuclease (patch repair protein)
MTDNMTVQQRSLTMSRIRSRDTKPELAVRRLAHARGLRYRVHDKRLPGRPDLAFAGPRIAVFVDGDFWHGRNFDDWSHKLAPYWKSKIDRNRARDVQIDANLRALGWRVLRFWEHDVERSLVECLNLLEAQVRGAGQPFDMAFDEPATLPN